MSYFSFLIRPQENNVTSCTEQHASLEILTPENIEAHALTLGTCNTIAINQQASKGKILIQGYSNTLNGFKESYPVNDNWEIIPIRANLRTWFFIIHPKNITSKSSFINGLRKIAKNFIVNNIDLNQWLRYNHLNKIFYLKEFSAIIDNVSQTKALMSYSEHFTASDLTSWMEHYKWLYPDMSYTHRLYLKRHVKQHMQNIKKMN